MEDAKNSLVPCPLAFHPRSNQMSRFPVLPGWHTFQHTCTTLLQNNGEDVKVVRELLRQLGDCMNIGTFHPQPACRRVPQIVKTEIKDILDSAEPFKGDTHHILMSAPEQPLERPRSPAKKQPLANPQGVCSVTSCESSVQGRRV